MFGLRFAVLAGFALAGLATSVHAQNPIKVGVLTELSGPLGILGVAERDGFLLYLKKTGDKLGGVPVVTVIEDTGNDPATALTKVRKLADSDKVDILLGPMNSASAAAIKTFVSDRQMPMLIQATQDDVSDNKVMFRTTFTSVADSYLQGYLAGKAGFRKAWSIAPNFNAGQDAITWFEKGFQVSGGTVIQKMLPRLGAPDFGSYIGQIDDTADVGLVFMAGADAIRFMKQFSDYGKHLPLYGFTAAVDEAILPVEGKAALGFVGATFYVTTIDSPANTEFLQEWQASYKGKPIWQGVSGYIMGQVLDAAIAKKHGSLADRPAFLAAIKEVKLTTPAGSFRFSDKNEPIQPRYITQVREVNGTIQPVILGTIPEFLPEPVAPKLPEGLTLPK